MGHVNEKNSQARAGLPPQDYGPIAKTLFSLEAAVGLADKAGRRRYPVSPAEKRPRTA